MVKKVEMVTCDVCKKKVEEKHSSTIRMMYHGWLFALIPSINLTSTKLICTMLCNECENEMSEAIKDVVAKRGG